MRILSVKNRLVVAATEQSACRLFDQLAASTDFRKKHRFPRQLAVFYNKTIDLARFLRRFMRLVIVATLNPNS